MAAIPLQARRRELIAAYRLARRRHGARAEIARRLVAVTCQMLKAEVRAARTVTRRPEPQPDLFGAAA
ncbi:MAG: hypothetical protein AB1592_13285 [Pseudomonadota bacterium]